ncbi:MAG: hypothetical protein FWH11_08310 [Micrococcales bacterium]|nr:hypothetical protein [Micrococcales bacterium]
MAERLLLEGADLPELMEYVRTEFGPTAKIVRAERVRQGGFAGFFAKEKFELTVEVPPPPRLPVRPLRSHRPPPPAPSSLDDLLAAADAADAAPGSAPGAVPAVPQPAPSPDQAREEIVAAPRAAAEAATPRAATGGSQFATVLDQVRALADEGLPPEALTAPAAPVETAVETAAVDETAPGGTGSPSDAPSDASSEALPDRPESEPGPVEQVDEPVSTAAVPSAVDPVTAPQTGTAAVPLVSPVEPAPPAAAGAALRAALAQLGVPGELLGANPLTLTSVLDQIPAAPAAPRGHGEVLALVGTAADLAVLEPLLVERMRLAPSDVVHVGGGLRFDPSTVGPDRPTRVSSATSLSAWRSRAPMARHPWLVLIPADGGAEARAEAAETAFAARPTQLWAVVDARTKPGDAARWLDQVGAQRPVDGLAVRALADTSAPGTVLGLGRPVVWLDGLPTSRVVWAAALGQPLDLALGP